MICFSNKFFFTNNNNRNNNHNNNHNNNNNNKEYNRIDSHGYTQYIFVYRIIH